MKKFPIELRCYIRKVGNDFRGCCIDLNLAAEGTSIEEVKKYIDEQITLYLGSIRSYKEINELVPRKASFGCFWEYYIIKFKTLWKKNNNFKRMFFKETLDKFLDTPSLRHA